jgi:hypothetical protein
MTNVELAEKVKGYLKGSAAKAKKFEDLVAVSFSLLSENTEDMYVAVRDGELLVDAYAYDDNNCSVEATAETVDKLFGGELSFDKAIEDGLVQIKSGDVAKFKALAVLVKKPAHTAAKKTEAPKAAPKATAEKKAEAPKPAEKKEEVAKPAEKPAAVTKAVAAEAPKAAAPKANNNAKPANKGKKKGGKR